MLGALILDQDVVVPRVYWEYSITDDAPVLIAASKLDTSDRPAVPEYVRVHTPCVVTSDDLDDVTTKMQNLEFDISTLVSWRLTRPGGGGGGWDGTGGEEHCWGKNSDDLIVKWGIKIPLS